MIYFKFDGLSGKYGSLLPKELPSSPIVKLTIGELENSKEVEIATINL